MTDEKNTNQTNSNNFNKGKYVRATCKWFRDTIDIKNPTIKPNLTQTSLQKIAEVNKDFAQFLYGGLASGELPNKISLKKMNDEQLKKVVSLLNIKIDGDEDLEDILNVIVDTYQAHLNKNAIEKKVSSSKLKISEVVFYIAKDLNKQVDLKQVIEPIKDFNWSIKNLDFKSAKYLLNLMK